MISKCLPTICKGRRIMANTHRVLLVRSATSSAANQQRQQN